MLHQVIFPIQILLFASYDYILVHLYVLVDRVPTETILRHLCLQYKLEVTIGYQLLAL